MWGAENISTEELWQRTMKAAEAHILWAKEEGIKKEVNWQDVDLSSAKGFSLQPGIKSYVLWWARRKGTWKEAPGVSGKGFIFKSFYWHTKTSLMCP